MNACIRLHTVQQAHDILGYKQLFRQEILDLLLRHVVSRLVKEF